MIKFIGVVILYQPDTTVLFDLINSYLPELDQLLLYNNSESPSSDLEQLIHSQNNVKIRYTYFGKNEGIAHRLNMAAHYAIVNEFDYLLMMDQDSAFELGDFNRYKQKISQNQMKKVAQFGVNCQPAITIPNAEPNHSINLITSGSVLQLSNFNQIGLFDERLFIDFVDTEFCYRAIDKGYINLQFSDIILKHRIGFLKMGRSFKNLKLSPRILHSPIRIYYIVRNGLFLLFKVNYVRGPIRKDLLNSMRIVKNDLIYHPSLRAVYANLFYGVFDFLRNKMGKK